MKSLYMLAAAIALSQTGCYGQTNSSMAGCGEPEASLAGNAPWRRLFLDAMVVEEQQGLTRIFYSAEKYDKNPLIKLDKPWEGLGPYIYGTVMWDEGKLKMWYQMPVVEDELCCPIGYAESKDGLHWVKPEMDLVKYKGKPTNLVIGRDCGLPCVIKVPNPESPDRKWALYNWGGDYGPHIAFSPDGIHWTWDKRYENLFSTSDVVNFFYDPFKDRYVSTYKTPNRRHRAVGIALSDDGYKWYKPVEGAVFGADDYDPDATQIYGMPVFPYQGCYIGMPWMYNARWIKYGKYSSPNVMHEAQAGSPRTVDVQLAWSWDLISWNRTADRKPFIELGPAGSWDGGQVYTARAPIVMGDELWFYYGAWDEIHDVDEVECAIGLAKLRLDGFCSMRGDNKEGWLISRREVFNTPKVMINAKCAANGYITAELVDRNNNVIPGFSKADCVPFTGDSVRGEITWKTGEFPKEWIDKDKKVKFYIKNADLYSYLPDSINQEIDDSRPDL